MTTKIECSIENAPKFARWFRDRGGIAHWQSINLSNPGASWTTPATHEDGTPVAKPTWQAEDTPQVVTDPTLVTVYEPREVKRLRIAVKRGDSFNLVLTDASSRRVRKAVAELGNGAFYQFDGDEAIIFQTRNIGTLADWIAHNPV